MSNREDDLRGDGAGAWSPFGDVVSRGSSRPRLGTVRAFDAERGLGLLVTDKGVEFAFHCTAIVDGSRTIALGTRVAFAIVAAPGGRYEATSLTPLERI